MADILNEMLNLSRAGYFADCAVVTEDKKSKAKTLLRKPGKGAPEHDSDQGRGYRAYLRATASGRDGSYLLDQKGPMAAGAKIAAKHLGEAVYNVMGSGTPPRSDSDVAKFAAEVEKKLAPLVPGRLLRIHPVDYYGQGRAVRIRFANISPTLAKHNTAYHNDPFNMMLTIDGFNADGSAKAKIVLEVNSAHYSLKPRMRKKSAKWEKRSQVLNHLVKYFKALALPAPRMESMEYATFLTEDVDPADFIAWMKDADRKAGSKRLKELTGKLGEEGWERALKLYLDNYARALSNKAKGAKLNSAQLWKLRDRLLKKLDIRTFASVGKVRREHLGEVPANLIEFAAQHGILLQEYEAKQLDQWWKASRPKLIKGSKATRQRRLNGCIKALRSVVRDGGVVGDGTSQDHLAPVPKKERDSEDQPRDGTPGELNTHPRKDAIGESRSDTLTPMESSMSSLTDAIAAFRSLDEANINAPSVDRKTAGKSQYSPKSRWPHQHWNEAGTPPADPESMAAATRSTAGVDKKMGYKADGREGVDVRVEDMDNDELGAFLDEMVNVSEGLEDLAHLIEKYVGVEHLRSRLSESNGDETAYELALAIGQAKYGETIEHLTRKGMALQNHFGDDDWAGDRQFAEAMLNDTLDRRGRLRHEQNLRAPNVGRKGPDGKAQMSPKSKFSRSYYPGPGVTHTDEPANMPADREAMAAATRSTAGVRGQGYGPDGREEVDVRVEQRQRPRGRGDVNGGTMAEIIAGIEDQSYPDELLQR